MALLLTGASAESMPGELTAHRRGAMIRTIACRIASLVVFPPMLLNLLTLKWNRIFTIIYLDKPCRHLIGNRVNTLFLVVHLTRSLEYLFEISKIFVYANFFDCLLDSIDSYLTMQRCNEYNVLQKFYAHVHILRHHIVRKLLSHYYLYVLAMLEYTNHGM